MKTQVDTSSSYGCLLGLTYTGRLSLTIVHLMNVIHAQEPSGRNATFMNKSYARLGLRRVIAYARATTIVRCGFGLN